MVGSRCDFLICIKESSRAVFHTKHHGLWVLQEQNATDRVL